MTTARERYEQKTKVVTFRVSNEIFDQIEGIKARTGLSNADLIILGAGLAEEEIKEKLGQKSGLEAKLSELRHAIQDGEQKLNQERERQKTELENEMKAYRLFSAGWEVEETALKLGITEQTTRKLFQEWAEVVGEKEAARQELLRGYLKKHLAQLKNRRFWVSILPSYTHEDRDEVEDQIDYCEYLLSHPGEIDKEWQEFLIAEYSGK